MIDIDEYSTIKQKHITSNDSDNGRTYTVDLGEDAVIDVMSVTTMMNILDKPALVPWAYNVGIRETYEVMINAEENILGPYEVKDILKDEKRDVQSQKVKGGNRGTIIHNYLECEIMGRPYDVDPTYQPYWDQVLRFLNDYQPEFQATEIKVVSLEHGYAGRLDNIVTIKAHPSRRKHRSLVGETGVFDLKTNKDGKVYPDAHLPQVEAYKHAATEMTDGKLPFDLSFGLVLGAGTSTYQPCVSYASIDTFLAIKNCYQALNDMRKNNPNARK